VFSSNKRNTWGKKRRGEGCKKDNPKIKRYKKKETHTHKKVQKEKRCREKR
jgi:hypothetical protein